MEKLLPALLLLLLLIPVPYCTKKTDKTTEFIFNKSECLEEKQ
jgi:hypothetical protein